MMDELNESRARVIHNMAHSIHAIQNFLAVVLAERPGPLSELQRDYLSSANERAEQLEEQLEALQHELDHQLMIGADRNASLSP